MVNKINKKSHAIFTMLEKKNIPKTYEYDFVSIPTSL